jgi:hypothetical protein
MPKEETLKKVSENGYLTSPAKNGLVIVAWRAMGVDHDSMLRFEKDWLAYADVSWLENSCSEGEAVLMPLER